MAEPIDWAYAGPYGEIEFDWDGSVERHHLDEEPIAHLHVEEPYRETHGHDAWITASAARELASRLLTFASLVEARGRFEPVERFRYVTRACIKDHETGLLAVFVETPEEVAARARNLNAGHHHPSMYVWCDDREMSRNGLPPHTMDDHCPVCAGPCGSTTRWDEAHAVREFEGNATVAESPKTFNKPARNLTSPGQPVKDPDD